MKVNELIEQLKKLDGNTDLYIGHFEPTDFHLWVKYIDEDGLPCVENSYDYYQENKSRFPEEVAIRILENDDDNYDD